MRKKLVIELEDAQAQGSLIREILDIVAEHASGSAGFSVCQEVLPDRPPGGLQVPVITKGGGRDG